MNKLLVAMAFVPASLFAVDGVTLINQAIVTAAGGFPYTISQPGSYRLSGNLTVPDANTSAILINASNVTLDLNGFAILGPTVCPNPSNPCSPTGTGNGVAYLNANNNSNVVVTNGTVSGMGNNGVYLLGNFGPNRVEKVQAHSNGGNGIYVVYGTVTGNIATLNGAYGILALFVTATGNQAAFNSLGDMGVACPSAIIGNTSSLVFIGASNCALANNATQ